jgi:hypothetical protein
VKLPTEINVAVEQAREMKRQIEVLGFNKMIIIPAGIADQNKYELLHEKMTEGYKESFQSDNFKADGGFKGLINLDNGTRIVLTKDVKELKDYKLFNETIGKSVDDLEASGGIFETYSDKDIFVNSGKKEKTVRGLDMLTYLIYQREYFKRPRNNGKHIDENYYNWITERSDQGRPSSGRFPSVHWHYGYLSFHADDAADRHSRTGCRLAGSFKVI